MFKEKYKDTIIIVIAMIMLLIMTCSFTFVKIQHNQQTIIAKLMTEQAAESENVLYDNMYVAIKDKLIPGETYRLTVDFQVKNRKGKRFLTFSTDQTDNLANLSCVKLEYSEKFVASKEHARVYLQMALAGDEIVTSDGTIVNFKTQKLAPVITIEKED